MILAASPPLYRFGVVIGYLRELAEQNQRVQSAILGVRDITDGEYPELMEQLANIQKMHNFILEWASRRQPTDAGESE